MLNSDWHNGITYNANHRATTHQPLTHAISVGFIQIRDDMLDHVVVRNLETSTSDKNLRRAPTSPKSYKF